jgi:hypothetical protein
MIVDKLGFTPWTPLFERNANLNHLLQKTQKFRFQSARLSLACIKAFAGTIIVEFGHLRGLRSSSSLLWTVMLLTVNPAAPHNPFFASPQGCFAERQWWEQCAGWNQAFVFRRRSKGETLSLLAWS